MEHYRSVFATAAAIVVTLSTAAHIAHPRDPADDRRSVSAARSIDTADRVPATWSDPPGAACCIVDAEPAGAQAMPVVFARLPAETAVLFTTMPTSAVNAPARMVTAPKRHRIVRQSVAVRTAGAVQSAPLAGSATASSTIPERGEKRVDLIGDLLRGLGIGREG